MKVRGFTFGSYPGLINRLTDTFYIYTKPRTPTKPQPTNHPGPEAVPGRGGGRPAGDAHAPRREARGLPPPLLRGAAERGPQARGGAHRPAAQARQRGARQVRDADFLRHLRVRLRRSAARVHYEQVRLLFVCSCVRALGHACMYVYAFICFVRPVGRSASLHTHLIITHPLTLSCQVLAPTPPGPRPLAGQGQPLPAHGRGAGGGQPQGLAGEGERGGDLDMWYWGAIRKCFVLLTLHITWAFRTPQKTQIIKYGGFENVARRLQLGFKS